MKIRLKKKGLIIIIAISLIILFALVYGFSLIERIKLSQIGYNKTEINIIIKKIERESLTYLFEQDYLPLVKDIASDDSFNKNNVERYINYSLTNNELEANIIVFMVNSNADSYPYSDLLLQVIKNKEYDSLKLESYANYITNYVKDYLTDISDDVILLVNNEINYLYSKELIGIVKEKYFIKERIERYIAYQKKNTKKSYKEIIQSVNCNNDYSYYTNIKEVDTSKGFSLLVNKYYKLDKDYKSDNLVDIGTYGTSSGMQLDGTAFNAFKKMYSAAATDGAYLIIRSPYRSYNTQLYIYNDYVKRDGKAKADTYSARPGHSEHQTGLAIDIAARYNSDAVFGTTEEFTWLYNNSYKYGFILRYGKDKTKITGYMYEPWHYRYVGIEIATFIHDNDLTLEEYYAYYVK